MEGSATLWPAGRGGQGPKAAGNRAWESCLLWLMLYASCTCSDPVYVVLSAVPTGKVTKCDKHAKANADAGVAQTVTTTSTT